VSRCTQISGSYEDRTPTLRSGTLTPVFEGGSGFEIPTVGLDCRNTSSGHIESALAHTFVFPVAGWLASAPGTDSEPVAADRYQSVLLVALVLVIEVVVWRSLSAAGRLSAGTVGRRQRSGSVASGRPRKARCTAQREAAYRALLLRMQRSRVWTLGRLPPRSLTRYWRLRSMTRAEACTPRMSDGRLSVVAYRLAPQALLEAVQGVRAAKSAPNKSVTAGCRRHVQ
jgi:hypothetical protein